MKHQNFYNFLESYYICPENILSYCEDIKMFEEDIIEYFNCEEDTCKKEYVNSKILGASSSEELSIKKEKEIKERKKNLENLSKFISFMKKEDELHLQVINSQEFSDWVDREENANDDFFEEINCVPAYIHKFSGALVLDLLKNFEYIIYWIGSEIERIIKIPFPINESKKRLLSVQNIIKKNKIILTKEEFSKLVNLVVAYEDFEVLTEIIKEDIKELEEPIKK